jgi:hypothetical protein
MLRRAIRCASIALVSLVASELLLRALHHQLLPAAVSNEVANPYRTGFGGIYDYEPAMHSNFFKPNHRQRMYFSGYRWEHRGDSRGFRNPEDRSRADVVLIGDSMIYGHGVEEEDTVRNRLEDLLGTPVSNLGMQGAAAHSEYQIVKRHAVELEPRYLFVFFLNNDIEDLLLLSEEEMMRFVSAPPDQRDVEYFDFAPRAESSGDELWELSEGLYVYRALRVLGDLLQREFLGPNTAHAARLPPGFRKDRLMSLAFLFHEMAVRRMHLLARDHSIEFVHVFLYTGQPNRGEDFFEEVLERFCASEGIAFLSLRPPLSAAIERGEQPFLERDGHLSPAGAQIVAESLAKWIAEHPLGPS